MYFMNDTQNENKVLFVKGMMKFKISKIKMVIKLSVELCKTKITLTLFCYIETLSTEYHFSHFCLFCV